MSPVAAAEPMSTETVPESAVYSVSEAVAVMAPAPPPEPAVRLSAATLEPSRSMEPPAVTLFTLIAPVE